MLLLDEPASHLDTYAQMALETAISLRNTDFECAKTLCEELEVLIKLL